MKEGTGNENEEQQNNILTDTPADNCINNPIVFDTCMSNGVLQIYLYLFNNIDFVCLLL